MDRKQRGNHKAAPREAGRPLQQQEKNYDIDCMQQDVGVVMSRRVETEYLNVERMRHPGERMPIRQFVGRQCPLDGVPGQTGAHMRVVGDVSIVVEIHERMMTRRVVENQRYQNQREAQNDAALFGRRKGPFGLGYVDWAFRRRRGHGNIFRRLI